MSQAIMKSRRQIVDRQAGWPPQVAPGAGSPGRPTTAAALLKRAGSAWGVTLCPLMTSQRLHNLPPHHTPAQGPRTGSTIRLLLTLPALEECTARTAWAACVTGRCLAARTTGPAAECTLRQGARVAADPARRSQAASWDSRRVRASRAASGPPAASRRAKVCLCLLFLAEAAN